MKGFPSREQVERLRQQYPKGTKICCDYMSDDPRPIPPGTIGEVVGVDDAGKVMTELDGTELFTRITERLTDEAMSERIAKAMAVFVDTVNMTVTQQKEKVFVIPDNIEEFDFRNYV